MFPPWVAGRASICIRPWARFFLALIGLSKGAWCAPALITLSFLGRQCYAEFISNILGKTLRQMSQFYSDVPLSIGLSFFFLFQDNLLWFCFLLTLDVLLQLQRSIDQHVLKSYYYISTNYSMLWFFSFKIMPIASSKNQNYSVFKEFTVIMGELI